MRETRSASQILFGHLPEQTVDVGGGIWRVRRWNDPKLETAVDADSLRQELIRAAWSWANSGNDGGFSDDLHRRRPVVVKSLNRERGVWCEPFPRLYLCRRCNRIHDEPSGRCNCGAAGRRGQLPFVGYHDACGALKSPWVRKCPQHRQRAVRFPGTAAAGELIFYCPECNNKLQTGFSGATCDCDQGGQLAFTVHRAASVFTPRGVVLINPPKREILRQIESAGDGERALGWMLDGMQTRRMTESPAAFGPDSIRRMLAERGFDAATIEAMVAAMPPQARTESPQLSIGVRTRTEAQSQARQVALATYEARQTIADLRSSASTTELTHLYNVIYPRALELAGLERVELIDRFPVLTAQFGYTRGDPTAGASRLRTYHERNGDYVVYGELAETEALFVRLDPLVVHRWLAERGIVLDPANSRSEASIAILKALTTSSGPELLPSDPVTKLLTTLVHSYAHTFIRQASVYAGIERTSLSELILPYAFGFFVYAAARGDFVLGGLQALFETELDQLLDRIVCGEHRCALDPGCSDNGGACAVCLHLGEPSCRLFNVLLSRSVLARGTGYFNVVGSIT